MLKVISIRENNEYTQTAIKYFQEKWGSPDTLIIYEDCISNCITSKTPLPQWYLLLNDNNVIGCGGLITNDFISRMDLYPWICAVYIEENYRGNSYGKLLLDKAKQDAKNAGFNSVYLCTDHIGYYEHYSFKYIADGYHPWGESSRIYQADI